MGINMRGEGLFEGNRRWNGTALHVAAAAGNVPYLKLLVSEGIAVEAGKTGTRSLVTGFPPYHVSLYLSSC